MTVPTSSTPLVITIAPTTAQLRTLVRVVSRRIRLVTLVTGLWLISASALALTGSGSGPVLSGLLVGALGVVFILRAVLLPYRALRRLPPSVRAARICEIDGEGLRVRATTHVVDYAWAAFDGVRLTRDLIVFSRRRGWTRLAFPRVAFSPADEAELLALLTSKGLAPSRPVPTRR